MACLDSSNKILLFCQKNVKCDNFLACFCLHFCKSGGLTLMDIYMLFMTRKQWPMIFLFIFYVFIWFLCQGSPAFCQVVGFNSI